MLDESITLDAAVILGSGLSGVFAADELEMVGRFDTGVAGHSGRLALWRREGETILVALGRKHLYEGIDPREAAHVVELAAARGARRIVVTNAAGGLDPLHRVGDIMLIRGLNALLLGRRMPLLQIGAFNAFSGAGAVHAGDRAGGRAGDSGRDSGTWAGRGTMTLDPFDHARLQTVVDRALERGVRLRQGVYAAVPGPSYETRAEIRMLRLMGASAVGMSTVPEYVAARRLGLEITGLSLITNTLSDTARIELDHADVVDAGIRAQRSMRQAIGAALCALHR